MLYGMTAEEMKERIIAFRKAQGLSQKELAKKSKLTQSTVSTMEHSNFYPSMYSFLMVCEGLDITPSQFFMSEDEAGELFTEQEYELINLWNCLNNKNRKLAFDIMTSMDKLQHQPEDETNGTNETNKINEYNDIDGEDNKSFDRDRMDEEHIDIMQNTSADNDINNNEFTEIEMNKYHTTIDE